MKEGIALNSPTDTGLVTTKVIHLQYHLCTQPHGLGWMLLVKDTILSQQKLGFTKIMGYLVKLAASETYC